jgi:hypothetical protein
MKPTVRIAFGTDEVLVNLPADEPAMAADDARRWLDQQFTARECAPVRASGKVLTVDKLLAVAAAIGRDGFERDEALRLAYARAALGATARTVVSVDVSAGTVSY